MQGIKNDRYRKNRGGNSVILDISCAGCNDHLFYYQKDGPGPLKRMYLDRIYKSDQYSDLENTSPKNIPQLVCLKCKIVLGVLYIYKPEKRLSYRVLEGKIKKARVKV